MTTDSLVVFDSPLTSKGKPRQRVSIRGSLAARFAAKVNKTDACWLWTAATNRKGYGTIGSGGQRGRTRVAHRVSWELHIGRPIPDGLDVLHRCDNPPCVNPAHLFLGTDVENVADMMAKGRAVFHNRLKTHCPNGHPYTLSNERSPRRVCMECRRAASRRRYTPRGVAPGERTHCPNGHAYDDENTYHHKGTRQCKACRREYVRPSRRKSA